MRRQGDQDAARGWRVACPVDPAELRDLGLLGVLSAVAPLVVVRPGVAAGPTVVAGLLTIAAEMLGLMAWYARRGHRNGLVAWPVVSDPPRRAL